ncbi:hypothetical protein OMR58_22485 [Erwinia sp. INIA-01]|uniref:hypothetical protein n=1 Tax=Erwinia sp. INIA01 TaxID=2991500 RepID=UPI0022245B5E|nr:hypothetical protein [Erwinia sp. INIA01]MCW1877220.1 hypothetical protein [Erwinia sp. INIA01]
MAERISAAALKKLLCQDDESETYHYSQEDVAALEGLCPDDWPTAGQSFINWDLSSEGRKHTIDPPCPWLLQSAEYAGDETASLVTGRTVFSDVETQLHPLFRRATNTIWEELDCFKLARAILHIAHRQPLSPVFLCLHEEGGIFPGGGTHRYEVLKRMRVQELYFLAYTEDQAALDRLLPVQWKVKP